MNPLRSLLAIALLSLCPAAFAQANPQQAGPQQANPQQASPQQVDTQKTFDQLKTLEGSWEGSMDGTPLHVSMRVTSMGNTLMHEMSGTGRPDDPITMFHLDNGRLLMTHYCDAGNQPRFVASASPDGKTVTFTYLDATNLQAKQPGHMQHVVFTFIDPDHHTELWQFAMADGKTMGGLLDLKRSK